jgi:hypothetical protein
VRNDHHSVQITIEEVQSQPPPATDLVVNESTLAGIRKREASSEIQIANIEYRTP